MHSAFRKLSLSLVVSALACGLVVLLDWGLKRPNLPSDGSELVIRSQNEVPKLLESRASRDQALAKAEAAKVKILQAKLKSLESASKRVQILAGNASDHKGAGDEKDVFRQAKMPGVLPGNTGTGYWDKEHKDDVWMPVGQLSKALEEKWTDNEAALELRKAGAFEWSVVGDTFEDIQPGLDKESAVENEVVNMNSQESEFKQDDVFVPPPEEITPTHRLPMETFVPWQLDFSTWLHSWTG